ncbi:VWA domain-containing protein [Frigoribacterium sp. ACAM 257]|nr:VWA domain-containing protein [Frigoribacterium sp. ACAM 257]
MIARAELVQLSMLTPGPDAEFLADVVRRFADDPVSGALPAGMVLAPYAVLRTRQGDQAPGAGPTSRPSAGEGCGGPSSEGVPTAAELEAVLGDPRLRVVPEHPGVAAGRRAAEKAAAARGDGADPTDGEGGEGDEGDEVEAVAAPRDLAEGQAYGLAETLRLWRSTDADGVVAAWYLAEARRWVRPLTQPALLGSDPDDTIPGALESWQLGDDVDDLDWVATLSRSPVVVPGVTTRRRDTLADAPPPRREGIELDLWVDSSGSMPGPERGSAALVAGTILVLSVLRGGGRVRVTSFSSPGQVAGGVRPTRDRVEALRDLTTFFGGGTTFPLDLLASRYRGTRLDPAVRRHLVVLSDDGLASMFGAGQPKLSGVAPRVRRVLDTATLVVLGASPAMTEQAEAAGYDVRVLPGVEDAPRLCAELAAVLADPPRRPEETRGC